MSTLRSSGPCRFWPLRRAATVLLAALCAGCQSTAGPEPDREPPVYTQPAEVLDEPSEEVIGTVRVTASALNIRDAPTTDAAKLETVRRGSRLGLVREEDGWSRVQLADGRIGWVASRFVREDATCPPDRGFTFVEPPVPYASSSESSHGTVKVEVLIDARGVMKDAKVVENTTDSTELADRTLQEIRRATFSPPVQNCRTLPFIYVYQRTY